MRFIVGDMVGYGYYAPFDPWFVKDRQGIIVKATLSGEGTIYTVRGISRCEVVTLRDRNMEIKSEINVQKSQRNKKI